MVYIGGGSNPPRSHIHTQVLPMFTAIIEFATLSMAALYVADAIAGIRDAHVARVAKVPVPSAPVAQTPEPEVLPDVCIPDEDIQAPATPEPETPSAPEPEALAPEVPATPEPEVPAAPKPKARKPRAPKAPKPKAPKPEEPKAPTVAELRAQAKARGLKGYSKLSKADLLALLAQ